MVLLRLLAVFIFSSLLSGCYLWGDYNSLKSDIRQLKFYLKAVPVPNECQPPGTPQRRVCYYKLKIKPFDQAQGLYVGRYQYSVLDKAKADCEKTRDEIKKEKPFYSDIDDDYRCVDPNKYRYVVYGFKLAGPQLPEGNHGLINIPGTEFLRAGTEAEAMWQPEPQEQQEAQQQQKQ